MQKIYNNLTLKKDEISPVFGVFATSVCAQNAPIQGAHCYRANLMRWLILAIFDVFDFEITRDSLTSL
ncbi:hypothetical protein BCF53_10297 [Reinekea marinisedimentorum]|uniref:Uncharacterized protein n=1 Tax=Reinekea marinisedimentorum TaxID=230495 RepID=A0A4R3IAS1_9GAMM|nr:hypothetical protein BCF53_10297 [Reinekea marinisedimentorum]